MLNDKYLVLFSFSTYFCIFILICLHISSFLVTVHFVFSEMKFYNFTETASRENKSKEMLTIDFLK